VRVKRNRHAGRRRSGGLGLDVFTPEELEDIHLSTLQVLEHTGVLVDDDTAMDYFAAAGCHVDRDTKIVRIPPHVVEEAIAAAPASILLAGRDPENDVVLESNRVGFCTFGEGITIVDPYSGELREPLKKDVGDAAKLADALDDIDTFEIAIGAKDAPGETASIHNFDAALANTTKCIGAGTLSTDETEAVIDMAAAAVGGRERLRERPIVYLGVCPVSPLKLTREVCEVIIAASKAGLPDNILSMAMSGGSAPANLAGTLVTHNAEVLSGITLAQLVRRGTPVIYGSSTTALDLRFATASVGSPECAMINAGVACLARQYRLPSYVAGA
jgi:trimethylamine--corrinoid protein Co-methyltransferase